MNNSNKLDFWNARARLGYCAGTNDVGLKEIEIQAIASHIKNGMRILDFGSGNCVTAIYLAQNFEVFIHCIDFSSEMIAEGKKNAFEAGVAERLSFEVGDVASLKKFERTFDCVYTERSIINLSTWEEQSCAIADIINALHHGGKYIMCESSMDGLREINKLRVAVQLNPIVEPWHNLYICDEKVIAMKLPDAELIEIIPFTATYYFLSRVVNAALARDAGMEPAYDSPINEMAKILPAIGTSAQVKLWLWRRY